MGVTSEAGTDYHFGAPLLFLVGFVLFDLKIDVFALPVVICPFVLFLLVIVLAVLRFTDSDYLFGTSISSFKTYF